MASLKNVFLLQSIPFHCMCVCSFDFELTTIREAYVTCVAVEYVTIFTTQIALFGGVFCRRQTLEHSQQIRLRKVWTLVYVEIESIAA